MNLAIVTVLAVLMIGCGPDTGDYKIFKNNAGQYAIGEMTWQGGHRAYRIGPEVYPTRDSAFAVMQRMIQRRDSIRAYSKTHDEWKEAE